MRRIWIGIGVLILLLAVSMGTLAGLERIHEPIVARLEDAAQEPRWSQAAAMSREAAQRWDAGRHFTAALADHEEMDQIDGMFAQLEVYRRQQDAQTHAALCSDVASAIRAIKEAHRLTWWNLL